MDFTVRSAGGSAVTVEFDNLISPQVNGAVMALNEGILKKKKRGILETIPSFRALTVIFDPLVISEEAVRRLISSLAGKDGSAVTGARVFHIPVSYGGDHGPDISFVADYHGISTDEVISRHSGRDYLIYMLGFLPGFAYLGGLDEGLVTPRLESPRTAVPAGAVGIGGEQTGIYPIASPGGWRLIGNTPVRPFDPTNKKPILYSCGDYIRFIPIGPDEYRRIEAEVRLGQYSCRVTEANI